jgi:sugar phosphate isomerase/epimerase
LTKYLRGDNLKLGISSSYFRDCGFEQALGKVKELGAQIIEIRSDWGAVQSLNPDEIRESLKKAGLEASVHSKFRNFESEVEETKDAVEFSSAISSKICVIHAKFADLIKDYVPVSKDLTIAIENSTREPFESWQSMRKLIDGFSYKNVGICMDIAHLLSAEQNIPEFISKLKENIVHIHISDRALGTPHLPVGDGLLESKKEEVRDFLKNFEGYAIVEGSRFDYKLCFNRASDFLSSL